MDRLYAIIAAVLMAMCAQAQELEYKMELGGMAGLGFYLGDANLTAYRNTTPAVGAVARYNINPRMALKGNLVWSKLKGSLDDRDNFVPDREGMDREFNKSLIDLGCQFEANFFGYGTGRAGYKGHKRLAPYIQGGLGFVYCGSTLTMNIPIGIGVKYKLMERVNVGLDWTMRFSLSDDLDGIADPYRIESGFLKNKDSQSWTMLYLTYDMFPRLRKCNND